MMPKPLKYWQVWDVPPCWLEIACPRVHEGGMSFGEKRAAVQELRNIEARLKNTFGYRGWVSYTELQNAHVMRFFAKLGATPFMIKDNKLYFSKVING